MADEALEALLDVQDLDITLDQLRHRRATLPARAVVAEADANTATIDAALGDIGARAAELAGAVKRLEDEVASLEAKAADADRKLYSGTVTAPRELQALQDEVTSVKRHARSVEDHLLEVMEEAEPVNADMAQLEGGRAAAVERRAGAVAELAEAEAAIDAELGDVGQQRDKAAAVVPDELLATYERLRSKLDGIGVARLEGNRCTGCHLTLPATEVDRIKRSVPGSVQFHEECGRILVRASS
jgi:predicted  nucleic acid-binding Zn-ribbon protein